MLGAAGCGYEYDEPKYQCHFLIKNLFGFTCSKYHTSLRVDKNSQHPLRCHQCREDASKDAWNKIVKQRP